MKHFASKPVDWACKTFSHSGSSEPYNTRRGMNLNILSRSFRFGTVGLLGTQKSLRSDFAKFIFRPDHYEPNVHDFMRKHYLEMEIVTGENVKEAQGIAYVLFTVKLTSPVRNARKLLQSVVRELQAVEDTPGLNPKKKGYIWADHNQQQDDRRRELDDIERDAEADRVWSR